MRNFVLGFLTAIILIGAGVTIYRVFPATFLGGTTAQPVAPENLVPGAKDFGTLQVEIIGNGRPLSGLEVDLGTIEPGKPPTGPMSTTTTDTNGVALFKKVPVGSHEIFFNQNNYPKQYNSIPYVTVEVTKNQTTVKKIELPPKH